MLPDFFMSQIYHITIQSPVGFLLLKSDETSLLSLAFVKENSASSEYQPPVLKEAVTQLNEYFSGTRKEFNLKINPAGSEFQKKVWEQVKLVPFGKTSTYLAIALKSGTEKHTRAVGLANGKNPLPIIIPCHRVIGSNNRLTGFAGGIEIKKWLLQHELKHSQPDGRLF